MVLKLWYMHHTYSLQPLNWYRYVDMLWHSKSINKDFGRSSYRVSSNPWHVYFHGRI